MRKFKHLDIHDRVILRELLIDDNFKKKNGTINLAKIGARKINVWYKISKNYEKDRYKILSFLIRLKLSLTLLSLRK